VRINAQGRPTFRLTRIFKDPNVQHRFWQALADRHKATARMKTTMTVDGLTEEEAEAYARA
jgi:hypothetical protein